MLTLSIIKADTGGFVGDSAVHPAMVAEANSALERVRGELLIDGQAATCGDDLPLIMTYGHGIDAAPIPRFDDPAFDRARQMANEAMDYFRRHGPFKPHRLDLDEMEYTTMPAVAERLADRWQPIPVTASGAPAAPPPVVSRR